MKRQETQPTISVGILRSKVIRFTLHGDFRINGNGSVVAGDQTVSVQDGKILYNNDLHDEIIFSPSSTTDSFDL